MFAVWTALIQSVDVQPLGQNGTSIGFATFNCWFHHFTGVNMAIYTITDWMGLVPVVICLIFAGIGLVQLIKRRSLFRVDADIMILGVYFVIVFLAYAIFEMIPINYRPILIEGIMEASYPSSTTLLVLSVMPVLIEQIQRRLSGIGVKRIITIAAIAFSVFMVTGRLISGVHWFTDIVGGVLLSAGLFKLYKAAVMLALKENRIGMGGAGLEFHEKLQELRKSRGLTQEELAEALFVSRTAISKWESGRGYPSIDSLKEISSYFSVSIDDLLSGEQLIFIAEKENKSNLNGVCDLLLGFVDLFSLMLIFLPLYPKPVNGYIYSVNLLGYVDGNAFIIRIYWALFISLTIAGIVKILMVYFKFERAKKRLHSSL